MSRGLACALALLAACARPATDADEVYARGDGERVLCGLSVDGEAITLVDIGRALDRAVEQGEVLNLFAHEPGRTITAERLDAIFALAVERDLPFVTFPELTGYAGPGLAFGFDDFYVEPWFALRESFARHGARVTFFVSNLGELDAGERAMLHVLAGEGHAIEAHGMGHRDAAVYVERYGLQAYLADEIDPLLEIMHGEGFAPTTFAYPYGDRTSELDRALLDRFALLRSLSYLDRSAINSAPCPH